MYTYIHTYIHTYIYVYMYIYVCIYIYIYIYTCVYVYIEREIERERDTYIYIYIHTYIHLQRESERQATSRTTCSVYIMLSQPSLSQPSIFLDELYVNKVNSMFDKKTENVEPSSGLRRTQEVRQAPGKLIYAVVRCDMIYMSYINVYMFVGISTHII